ncbi:isopeptide-forming domain-containing fimbrial protein, partial [Bacillus sp. AFS019443]|uniref:isopeptide-forming domain-containing fimbrial protein n=2 Tax=Bacillaceae TaxID=186817 RepID=UPI000BFAEF22
MRRKSIRRYVSIISLIFLVSFSMMNIGVSVVRAAMIDVVDAINISRADGTTGEPYNATDRMRVDVEWSAKGKISAGDQFIIDMPKEFNMYNTKFDLKAAGNQTAGTCELRNGSLTCTMSDYVNGKNNIKGSLFLEYYFALESYDGVKEIPLEFKVNGEVVNKHVSVSNTTERPPVSPNTDNLIKWGYYNEDGTVADWNVYVNATGTEMKEPKISDELGPGHELIPESIVLQEAVFEDGYAPKDIKLADLSKINILATKSGFTIELPDTSKGYILSYKTKVTNPALKPHKNTIKLEGKNIETEEKTEKVIVNNGGGTGSGENESPSIEKSIVDENGNLVNTQQLSQMNQSIHYQIRTHIPTDAPNYESMEISDNLEDVLEIIDAKVNDQNGQDITSKGKLTIDKQNSEVTFILNKDFDFKAYQDQTISLDITAKIKTEADLTAYVDQKIPNKAVLFFDSEALISNKVTVKPPESPQDGVIKIHKVDADDTNKGLEGAEFEIRNERDEVVAILKTDKNGFSSDQALAPGSYKIYEKLAPEGYEKLAEPILFKIEKGMINPIQLEISNKRLPKEPEKPETTEPEKPETTEPEKPETTEPEKPGTTEPEKPGTT